MKFYIFKFLNLMVHSYGHFKVLINNNPTENLKQTHILSGGFLHCRRFIQSLFNFNFKVRLYYFNVNWSMATINKFAVLQRLEHKPQPTLSAKNYNLES